MRIVIYKDDGSIFEEYQRYQRNGTTFVSGLSIYGQSDFVTTELPLAIETLMAEEDGEA